VKVVEREREREREREMTSLSRKDITLVLVMTNKLRESREIDEDEKGSLKVCFRVTRSFEHTHS
jgi:hypothetical protein